MNQSEYKKIVSLAKTAICITLISNYILETNFYSFSME